MASDEIGAADEDGAVTTDSLRLRVLRVGVIGIVVVACFVAAVYYVEAIRDLDRKAGDNSALDFQDRQIAGGNVVLISQDPLAWAKAIIPPTATYRVVTGPNLGETTGFETYVPDYFRYFLMPRRQTDDASWIICYGCDSSQWGDRYRVLADAGNGITVGRLRQ
jgi:hypothetical protein